MCTMDYTQYVNTNIGTVAHLLRSTLPLVQSPHGAAVITPRGRNGVNDHYNTDKIFGFSVGSALLMPAVCGGAPDYNRTASVFDHDFETARPDHYEVLLEDGNIEERHTAFRNYGVFSFTFAQAADAHVVLYTGKKDTVRMQDGRMIIYDGRLYTLLDTSAAVQGEVYDTGVVLTFASETVELPFVVSAVDEDTLFESYAKDVQGKSYDDVYAACKDAWNRVLGKIRVEGGTEAQKRVFYTALYRATCRMHDYSVCGKYRGYDGQVHEDEGGYGFYCDDGIWDTFRGMHPLQLLLEPEAHRGTLESYLRMYKESGWLPLFPQLGGNVACMLGHHTVSILAESMVKGVDFDTELAYEAAYKNATQRTMLPWREGEAGELTKCFYEKGFFPALDEDEKETCDRVHSFENRQAVAVTIEQSYDAWCLAQMAEGLGKTDDAAFFRNRSMNYKKLYDPAIGFFHPRKIDGSFTNVYDPKYCGGQGGRKYFAENNAYIYQFAAQHDVGGMMELMGGREGFAARLDNLFVEQFAGHSAYGQSKYDFFKQFPDATGLVGQFCMGNEPSFHIPYLYNYCGQAYKTQRKIHELIDLWFPDSPLGICGDEDGGAMSAFLVFSAMGFYPVSPASGNYDLGSPLFDRIDIDLPNGKTFTVRADGASRKMKYIGAASLGGKDLTVPFFSHAQMMEGGELTLTMQAHPNKELFA